MLTLPTFARDEYTVGWICALYFELAAAQAILDELHKGVQERDPVDKNSYTLGRVEDHNVAITCLPAGKYGTNDAASVANDMVRTFTNIKIVLLVGIGGGIPSPAHDIRLGDIVVSQPSGTSGGVIQYDIGKIHKGSKLQRTGHLNSPPTALLTALNRVKAEHYVRGTQIPNILRQMILAHPKMAEDGHTFSRLPNDQLYHDTCEHSSFDPTCHECESSHEVLRLPRNSTDPIIHYGTIASGNQVIKDTATREQLKKDYDALCVEMEGAGVMAVIPCLVIRGISDYADSRKNDIWQKYAATTAAAFAKELLRFTDSQDVHKEKSIVQVSGEWDSTLNVSHSSSPFNLSQVRDYPSGFLLKSFLVVPLSLQIFYAVSLS
jgi:nucleoside phosphorylase